MLWECILLRILHDPLLPTDRRLQLPSSASTFLFWRTPIHLLVLFNIPLTFRILLFPFLFIECIEPPSLCLCTLLNWYGLSFLSFSSIRIRYYLILIPLVLMLYLHFAFSFFLLFLSYYVVPLDTHTLYVLFSCFYLPLMSFLLYFLIFIWSHLLLSIIILLLATSPSHSTYLTIPVSLSTSLLLPTSTYFQIALQGWWWWMLLLLLGLAHFDSLLFVMTYQISPLHFLLID